MADRDPHDDDPALEMLPEDDDEELLVQEGAESPANPPNHPIPSMQGPFEESILESEQLDANAAVPAAPKLSAKARHERLLANRNYNDSYNAKWRAQPSAKWHPLSKIIAQVAFGVHLLHSQLAKSDEEVVKILQRHVDEVDNFIQNTGEDFDSALVDIQERINYLKLPLEHVKIFDIMLDDKQFRNQIIHGNEKIEQIVERTANLMNDLLTDVHKGLEATTEMALYLDRIADAWPQDESSLSIFNTMQANAEGWTGCFQSLQMKGNSLGVALVQLGSILNEMSKRAGVASRRSVTPRPSSSSSSAARHQSRSTQPTSRYTRPKQTKPLPEDPDLVARAVEATLPRRQPSPKWHPIPFEERWEKPRERPQTPQRRRNGSTPDARELPSIAATSKSKLNPETAELTTFFRDTGPDKSPPKTKDFASPTRKVSIEDAPATTPTQKPKRTRSKLKRKPSNRQKAKDGEIQAAAAASAPPTAVKSPLASSSTTRAPTRHPTRSVSPTAPDSAYSSGSNEQEKRPTTSPSVVANGVTAARGKFSLFPSAGNSVMSSRFPSELSLPSGGLRRRGRTFSDAAAPAPEVRRGSESAVGVGAKRRSSLQSLRRWFSGRWEKKRDGEVGRRRMVGVGESLEVVPEAY